MDALSGFSKVTPTERAGCPSGKPRAAGGPSGRGAGTGAPASDAAGKRSPEITVRLEEHGPGVWRPVGGRASCAPAAGVWARFGDPAAAGCAGDAELVRRRYLDSHSE